MPRFGVCGVIVVTALRDNMVAVDIQLLLFLRHKFYKTLKKKEKREENEQSSY